MSARNHAEKAKAIVGGIGTSRSWLGANASAALGAVLAAEGKLADAERELTYAEHFFKDEVATVHHAWLLVLLARVRVRRGRLDEAEATLRGCDGGARRARRTGGAIPALADEVERELEAARSRAGSGELLESPTEAELAVLRLLATDLSMRQIGEQLFLSPNTIRRTSVRSTASSASTPAQTPSHARPRSACWGKRNHPGDRLASPVNERRTCHPGVRARSRVSVGRRRRVERTMAVAFEGMTLTREDGRTVLTGPVRDQAELQGFLQRVSDLGLTLLEATADRRGRLARRLTRRSYRFGVS